jgi:hypothetical protein
MSIIGKKFGSFANKIGQKMHFKDIKKFGTKALSEGKHVGQEVVKQAKDAQQFGKEAYGDVKKFGTKAIKMVDKGLVVGGKVIGGIDKVVSKTANVISKLEGVPVLGEFAGLGSSALKQVGAGVKVARKGIVGLEKSVRSVESLGDTIGKSKRDFKSGNDDRIADGIKNITTGLQGVNPFKR